MKRIMIDVACAVQSSDLPLVLCAVGAYLERADNDIVGATVEIADDDETSLIVELVLRRHPTRHHCVVQSIRRTGGDTVSPLMA